VIGHSIGRYHVLEKLGEGGMAAVYRAFDTRLDREVALKVIQPLRQESPEFLKRFEREAKALAQLVHPNIVSIHDYGEHEGTPYLVMEYTPGGTLKQRLGQPMPWPQACRLLAPIARALHYAHQQKIVHRDVKPSNILISASGDPKLSDFGIAKILEMEKTWDLTGTGVGIGTPEYMAPEQGMGKPVDHRADIYALGIVFFELLTGRTPFQADTPLAVLLKQVNDPLPRPREFARDLPREVEQAIFKALAKDPANRFQSMGDFAEALEALRREAKAGDISTLIAPRSGLRRVGLIAGAATLLVLIAVGVRWAVGASKHQGEPAAPTEESAVVPAAAPTQSASRIPRLSTDAAASGQVFELKLYDDFESQGTVNPMRWWSDTDFQVVDGAAFLQAVRGDEASYRSNLASAGVWSPAKSGSVRFAVEVSIRVDPAVFGAFGPGSAGIQVSGPHVDPETWWFFEFGYAFETGFIIYDCSAGRWDSSEPPPFYSEKFGTPIFGEWHTFRISVEQGQAAQDLMYVGYVDGKASCSWVPPDEWQDAIRSGPGLDFFMANAWQNEWLLDRSYRAYFDDVKVGTGTDG
jgi:hypothetical protein